MRRYLNKLAVSLSITANAMLAGKRYEMLSSRAYRCGWWPLVALIDAWFELVFDDFDHCRECFEKQTIEGIYQL